MRVRAAVALACALLSACTLGTWSEEEIDRAYPMARSPALGRRGMEKAVGALRARVGGRPRVRSLSLWDDAASIEAQNPRRPADLDTYTYYRRTLQSPRPVQMSSSDEEKLEASLFYLDEVPFALIPGLARRAPTEVGIEGGRVTHLDVRRDDGVLVMSFSVGSPRRSGSVVYDAAGEVVRADRM